MYELIIAAIPVIIAPVWAWFFGRSAESKEKVRIECLDRCLSLIERLIAMKERTADEHLTELIDSELENCKSYLASKQRCFADIAERQRASSAPDNFLRRLFLLAPSQTIRQRIFKGLFYFFLFVSLVGGLGGVMVLTKENNSDWPYLVIGLLFYLALALVFRSLARPKWTEQQDLTSDA